LKQIVITMNEYQRSAALKTQEETKLLKLEAALQSNWDIHTHRTAVNSALDLRNRAIINSNELLNAGLLTLETRHEKLLKQRNDYGIWSLAAIGITGASSITAYFLMKAGVMSPLFGLMGAAVCGAAIIGLIITSVTFTIMAALKNDEIHTQKHRILNNETESAQNAQSMTTFQETELPNLTKLIFNLQEQVPLQIAITDAARQAETLLLEKAKNIQVNRPGAGHFNHSFFTAASAPLAEEYLPMAIPVDSM
jgi:hypothetical protein